MSQQQTPATPTPSMMTPFILYGAGQLSPQDLFNQIYTNKWVQLTIAIGLALLISFEHELHVFSRKETFYILLFITLALIFFEYNETGPGLIILMVVLTAVSFQLSTAKKQQLSPPNTSKA